MKVVGPQSVAVCVVVGEQTGLEHLVRRRLDTGHEVRGCEGQLLHFGKVVGRVAVQAEAANGDEGELVVGPNFGDVERVPAVSLRLFEGHHLHVERPGGEVAALDGTVEVANGVVWVRPRQLTRPLHAKVADALSIGGEEWW